MDREIANKIMDVQERVMRDPEYQALMEEHSLRNGQFLKTVRSLPREQQEHIFDYLGVVFEMHLHTLKMAVK